MEKFSQAKQETPVISVITPLTSMVANAHVAERVA
jgi:hypothetical protein